MTSMESFSGKEKSSSIISTSISFDDFGVKMQRKPSTFFTICLLNAIGHEIWADH